MDMDERLFRLDGETRVVGVMGWPIAHSMSPAMHNAVLRDLGLNGCYVPFPVRPGEVQKAIQGLVALGVRGVNVTVPHKEAVMHPLDEIAPEARAVGAVNTVVIERRGPEAVLLRGTNTDVPGFLSGLHAHGFDPHGAYALVVGAGGAARSVVFALLEAGAARVKVLNRTPSRARALVEDFASPALTSGRLDVETLTGEAAAAGLLVNATTVGMWPKVGASIWPDGVAVPSHLTVYDLVYNPVETRLLRQAREAGAGTIDGLGMLARQGALSLDMWVDEDLVIDEVAATMRRVAEQVLTHGERP
jgi:shikimate dehydrogenase